MRAFRFMRRLVGLVPKKKPTAIDQAFANVVNGKLEDVATQIASIPGRVIEAPQRLKDRMEKIEQMPPPSGEEVETQMKFSAAYRRCLDQGMTYDEAKDYVAACSDDIKAGIEFPWRKKVSENVYEGSCGCRFNSDGLRTYWCGDHY